MHPIRLTIIVLILFQNVLAESPLNVSWSDFDSEKIFIQITNNTNEDILIDAYKVSNKILENNIGYSVRYIDYDKIAYAENGQIITPLEIVRYIAISPAQTHEFVISIKDLKDKKFITTINITFGYCNSREFHERKSKPEVLKLFSSEIFSRIKELEKE